MFFYYFVLKILADGCGNKDIKDFFYLLMHECGNCEPHLRHFISKSNRKRVNTFTLSFCCLF